MNKISTCEVQLKDRYLDLLRKCLTRSFPEPTYSAVPPNNRTWVKRTRYRVYGLVQRILNPLKLSLVQTNRAGGETMMGMGALKNLDASMRRIHADTVPGDFVETGVWRGGGTIYMRAFLEAFEIPDRSVWVCDSFEGLPKPKAEYEADKGSKLWESEYLAVSVEQVKENFRSYGLLDERVHFLKGFFSDTMPKAPIGKIALLRLDGDMYESTMVVLEHLYPKVSVGGIVIIDDYGMLPECNKAVEDFRTKYKINDELRIIGIVNEKPLGAWWCKS